MQALPPIEDVARFAKLVESLPGWRKIGDILVDLGHLTDEQLANALERQRGRGASGQPIGLLDLLIESDDIDLAQANDALQYQVLRYFLPALARALNEAHQARDELSQAYRRSLTALAAQSETISIQEHRISELRREVAALRQDVRALQSHRGQSR